MYFVIIDNRWGKIWAHGRTDTKVGVISFPEVCKYLLSSLHPEIFTLNLYDEDGKVIKRIPLIDYNI